LVDLVPCSFAYRSVFVRFFVSTGLRYAYGPHSRYRAHGFGLRSSCCVGLVLVVLPAVPYSRFGYCFRLLRFSLLPLIHTLHVTFGSVRAFGYVGYRTRLPPRPLPGFRCYRCYRRTLRSSTAHCVRFACTHTVLYFTYTHTVYRLLICRTRGSHYRLHTFFVIHAHGSYHQCRIRGYPGSLVTILFQFTFQVYHTPALLVCHYIDATLLTTVIALPLCLTRLPEFPVTVQFFGCSFFTVVYCS